MGAAELLIVTFKWTDSSYRAKYTSEHVNILASAIRRNYLFPHRVVCYTDDPNGLDSAIEARPLWNDLASIPNPTGGGRPSCYRRLRLFAPEIQDELSERFVMLDLDTIITGDLAPLWNRPEPLVFLRCIHPGASWHYNGGMWLGTRNCAPELWTEFDAEKHPQQANTNGFKGSDQGWINYRLWPGLPTWGPEDGVHRVTQFLRGKFPPRGSRIIFCFGDKPPWTLKHFDWVRRNYW